MRHRFCHAAQVAHKTTKRSRSWVFSINLSYWSWHVGRSQRVWLFTHTRGTDDAQKIKLRLLKGIGRHRWWLNELPKQTVSARHHLGPWTTKAVPTGKIKGPLLKCRSSYLDGVRIPRLSYVPRNLKWKHEGISALLPYTQVITAGNVSILWNILPWQ